MTASDLAQIERLQPQSVTRLIADLEERGLIRRKQDAGDRRQFLLAITSEGHDLLAEDARRQNMWLARKMAETLTPAEREILGIAAGLMERLSLPQADETLSPEKGQRLPLRASLPEEETCRE
jgi:DNA-binding MarR family transcriptional regulator